MNLFSHPVVIIPLIGEGNTNNILGFRIASILMLGTYFYFYYNIIICYYSLG